MNFEDRITAVIADDHPMLLQGLESTLLKSGVDVLVSAKDGTSALQAIIDHQPDVAIVDVEMPYLTGFNIAKQCQNVAPNTKFIILSYHKEAQFIVQARKLNIFGYVLKEDTSTEIIICLAHVLKGEFYYSPSIMKEDLDYANKYLNRLALLSPSEKKILKMIATPLSNKEIADRLFVSVRTIEKHRSNIILKLELPQMTNILARWAIEQKDVIMNF